MSVTPITTKAKGALVLNDLCLGRSQLSIRTDNVLAAKLNKLKWAISEAEENDGIVLLTGKVFDKANSFIDLALIIQQEIMTNPRVYLVADHFSYHVNGQIAEKTMMGVLKSIYEGKVVFDGPLALENGAIIMPRINWLGYSSENAVSGDVFLLDNNKKVASISDQERGVYILANNRGVTEGALHGYGRKIKPSFRVSVHDYEPVAYWITGEGGADEVIIPHESYVFREDVLKEEKRREVVKETAELSITSEFDPRKSQEKKEGSEFERTLDGIYNKSKISKTAYDIIKGMAQIK